MDLDEGKLQKLQEDFPQEALSKDTSRGFELTSIKAMYVIERLNHALGLLGWGFHFTPPELVGEEYTTCVTLELYEYESSGQKKTIWEKSQYGGKRIVKDRHTDALKACVTDGLTKCASFLGVGHKVFKGEAIGDNAAAPKQPKDKEKKPKATGTGKISEGQVSLVWGRATSVWPNKEEREKEIKGILRGRYKIESTKDMTKDNLDDYLEYIERVKKSKDKQQGLDYPED